jgi:lysozyme family protein
MPIFVWIAIAIAILLIGGGAATAIVAEPVAEVINSPVGYAIAIALVALVGLVAWKHANDGRKSKDDE